MKEADDGDFTALHLAVANSHKEVVRCLLERGARVEARDQTENTALLTASTMGSLDMAEILLAGGADTEARSLEYGVTSLHWASFLGRAKLVKLLLRYKEDASFEVFSGHRGAKSVGKSTRFAR